MSYRAIKRGALGAATAIALVLAATPAGALAATSCTTTAAVSQPFLSFGDTNWYALVPGQSVNSFTGTGWTLTGGAKIVTATLYNGTTGYVLDLPSGATAVSPAICVDSSWPTARTMMRNVAGSAGINVTVAYLNDGPFSKPQTIGTVKASGTTWSAPNAMNIHSIILTGPQQAQFTLTGTGTGSEYQLYNFYVDPRML